jgi:hypothetical protein
VWPTTHLELNHVHDEHGLAPEEQATLETRKYGTELFLEHPVDYVRAVSSGLPW